MRHRANQGAPRSTLHGLAPTLLKIAHELKSKKKMKEAGVARVARQAMFREFGRRKVPYWRRYQINLVTRDWFSFLGILQEAPIVDEKRNHRFSPVLEKYIAFLKGQTELSESSIRVYERWSADFLTWFSKGRRPFHSLSIEDVDAYFRTNNKRWHRRSLGTIVNSLRYFFRYAEKQKLSKPGVADAIRRPRIFAQEEVPSGPSWEMVQKLISDSSSDRKADIRDRAILILLAFYGLRSSELVRLRIENIDWKNETITIFRQKVRRSQIYPLTAITGNAILRYLREARPVSKYPEIFLTLQSPIRPLAAHNLCSMTKRRYKRLNLYPPHRGPHGLRHACASHLINNGLSLKEISDHLGHRSAESSCIYAKVNLAGLREVAEFDLGGVA